MDSYIPVIEIMSKNVTAPEAATQVVRILSLANTHHIKYQNFLLNIPCNPQMVRLLNWALRMRQKNKKSFMGICYRSLYRILHNSINMLIR